MDATPHIAFPTQEAPFEHIEIYRNATKELGKLWRMVMVSQQAPVSVKSIDDALAQEMWEECPVSKILPWDKLKALGVLQRHNDEMVLTSQSIIEIAEDFRRVQALQQSQRGV